MLEKALVTQLNPYMSQNCLFETTQYKVIRSIRVQSTPSSLMHVQNDILRALDQQEAVVLALFDLS